MEHYDKICDDLWDDVECGPGENPIVLKRAEHRLREILDDPRATTYVREKVLSTREQLRIWFSARRWDKQGDGGVSTKMYLQQDIEKVRQACQVAFRSKEPT